MNDTQQQVVYAITVVAAFAVGTLVGKSACVPQPETKTKVVTKRVPRTCDTGVPESDTSGPDAVGDFDREPPEAESTSMPEAPPAPDPVARKKLLSWVRGEAPNLRGCREPGASGVQLTVTLDIDDDGVRSVQLNAPEDALSADAVTCLRNRMQAWKAPADLIDGRKKVVFGLEI